MKEPAGVLLVDKDPGPTSHDLVARVRRLAGTRRVGHAGTLDPFASGLLLILVGAATRLSEYFLGMDKGYEGTACLGVETDTHDREGAAVATSERWRDMDAEAVRRAMGSLTGVIRQLPPRYSAKKVQGESAHRRARRGEDVELQPVEVEIRTLELLELAPPRLRFRMECSSGTYVRALARDLGRALGVGAHLVELRRTFVGPFQVESAFSLDALGDAAAIREALIPPARSLEHLPSLEVSGEGARAVGHGLPIPLGPSPVPEGVPVRVVRGSELVAVGYRRGEELRPRKVLIHD